MILWKFSWIFCDFQSIFRAFKQFLDFSGIVFALKINSKKQNLSFPNGPSPKSQPALTHLRPALARVGVLDRQPTKGSTRSR
jgi:hypothetical protein